MTSFLEGVGLWALYTLAAGLYLIIVLLMICVPVAALYWATHTLATLFARARDADRERAKDEGRLAERGSPLRHPRVPVQVERARETRRTDGRGGGKDREGRADARADP